MAWPRQLEAEGGGLGVDAVRAPDAEGVGVPQRQLAQGRRQRRLLAQQQVAGAADRQGEPGVEHVGRGQAVVDPARRRPHPLGDVGEEGDHVVVGRPLELLGALDGEAGARLDLGQVLGRDHPARRPGAADGQLDLQPARQLGLLGPDRGHRGAGVARDHCRAPRRGHPGGDVAAHLAPVEGDQVGGRVGPLARLGHAAAARADRQHPAARGHDRAALPRRRARVVDLGAGRRGRVEPADLVARPRRPRVARRRQHHGHGGPVVHGHRPVLQAPRRPPPSARPARRPPSAAAAPGSRGRRSGC